MCSGITLRIRQTDEIVIHQRTVGVEVKTFVIGVVTERVQRATEWFVFTHVAACGSQVRTTAFDAYRPELFLLFRGQGDLKGRIAILHIAASLALRTVVKQHALTPQENVRFD